MPEVNRQSPTPTGGEEGSDLRSVANKIEGLLDDDGHFNPNPEQLSRGHPDYKEEEDPRTGGEQTRDARGRFQKEETGDEVTDDDLQAEEDQSTGNVQDTDTEGDTEDEQAASADQEAEQEDTETGAINTLTELAEALEIPFEDLQANLTHKFRAAGEEVEVNLGELVAGYQKDADYRRQTSELAEARRKVEMDYTTKMQEFEQQNVYTAHMMNIMEKMFAEDLNSEKLAVLRTSDPAEWAARREEIGQRLGAIQQARQSAAQQYDKFRFDSLTALRERENKELLRRIPEFGTDHKQLAKKTLDSLGFAEQEIHDIFDHRLVLGALELASLRAEVAQLREEKAKAKDTVKRVKKTIPKFQKPGKQKLKGRGQVRKENVSRLRKRAAKSGTVQDAAAVIETMMR